MKPINFPMPAWLILNMTHTVPTLSIQRITVTAMMGDKVFYQLDYNGGRTEGAPFYKPMPPVTATCTIHELASTRARALEKIDRLMTALEARPPLSHNGQGQPPVGTTASRAANPPLGNQGAPRDTTTSGKSETTVGTGTARNGATAS